MMVNTVPLPNPRVFSPQGAPSPVEWNSEGLGGGSSYTPQLWTPTRPTGFSGALSSAYQSQGCLHFKLHSAKLFLLMGAASEFSTQEGASKEVLEEGP